MRAEISERGCDSVPVMTNVFPARGPSAAGAAGSIGSTPRAARSSSTRRASGRRAIVYDTAGTFVEKFYRPGKDILLNPLDKRTAIWSPWVDVPRDYHYDQIAESMIPDKHGDPFWSKAARGTLVAVMRKLAGAAPA